MEALVRHVTRSMIAGFIALLPILGTVLLLLYLESEIADGIRGIEALKGLYFPGLGLLLVAALVYVTGLFVSTFLGRLLIRMIDAVLRRVPLAGPLYDTLKQILGYGEGKDAVFERVVLLASREQDAQELGLVTGEVDGGARLIVFVPGSPNPTTGRLLVVDRGLTRDVDMTVNDALTALVSVGKSRAEAMTA